jgi:predicted protein tyrosine phosphatase
MMKSEGREPRTRKKGRILAATKSDQARCHSNKRNSIDMNVLFVCSRNKWRSRTAETIFNDHQHHIVKSAGTANDATVTVTEKLINWADLIFVMEKRHKQRLQDKFEQALHDKTVIVLDIEDNYQYMDEELIDILKTSVTPYL